MRFNTDAPIVLQRLAIALACLCPLLATAQAPLPVLVSDESPVSIDRLMAVDTSTVAGTSSQVVPLWASDDGRLLAIVGLATPRSGAPALPPSPSFGGLSDLRIIDATNLFSTGLRWNPAHGVRADFVVGVASAAQSPVARLLDCATAECLWSTRQTANLGAALGVGFATTGERPMDLSFGLSWLSADESRMSSLASFTDPMASGMTLLTVAGGEPYHIDSALALSARGSWQLGKSQVLDLMAGMGRSNASPLWYGLPGAGIELNQMSLGVGLASGSIRGSIVGHVVSVDDPAANGTRRWSGVDLGVSWRTPWRAELSVGAQNLWAAPLDVTPSRDADAAQARMPYVQYRQDL